MNTAAHVVNESLNRGLLVCSAGEHTVRLLPPLVATQDELAEGLKILESIL
jgi:acetylornithine/N-succinyldiaminopimelate aminotransferase